MEQVTANEPENLTQSSPEPKKEREVQIFLVNDEETKSCEFWIGLFAKGPLSPNHLFYKSTLMEVFDTASKEGLAEVVPVMLSDTTANKSKYIYLLPQLGEHPLEDQDWIDHILQAVRACKPKAVGIYLSPEAMKDLSKSEDSLRRVLQELIQQTDLTTIALYPGEYGTTSVLNVALGLKATLKTGILVYH